jgi:hypothetical protein
MAERIGRFALEAVAWARRSAEGEPTGRLAPRPPTAGRAPQLTSGMECRRGRRGVGPGAFERIRSRFALPD